MKPFNKKIVLLMIPVLVVASAWLYISRQPTKDNQTKHVQQVESNLSSSSAMSPIIENSSDRQEKEMATSNENNQRFKDVENNIINNTECKYLAKVKNLLDLVKQLRASAYNNCLQKISTKELEIIWGITIHEINYDQLYIDSHRTESIYTESYRQELNKPYHQPNDAYVVLRIHKKQFDTLEITATKDYLRQFKGLNQWIPFKPDNGGWGMTEIETSEDVEYKKPDLLAGFIEPSTIYYYPGDIRAPVKVGFTVEALENNYVNKIKASIMN